MSTTTKPEPYVCTAAAPWNPSIKTPVVHPDAVDAGECADGCCDRLQCPHCGHRWLQEVPQ